MAKNLSLTLWFVDIEVEIDENSNSTTNCTKLIYKEIYTNTNFIEYFLNETFRIYQLEATFTIELIQFKNCSEKLMFFCYQNPDLCKF